MTCPSCNGPCETTPSGLYARCTACQRMYTVAGQDLRPVELPPGTDMALFASGVGFGGGPPLPPDPMEATKRAFAHKASNLGVRARVGGVQVDLDKGGVSVDTSRLEKKLEQKVEQKVSQWIFGCILTVFIFGAMAAVLVLVAGYVGWEIMAGGSPADAAAAEWDGKTPFVCPANGNVTISGVTANLSGTAVEAGGNCVLTLDDVDITADTAVHAGGNAKVTISGGHLKGKEAAVSAMGNATVTASGVKVEGPVKKLGGAKVSGI